MFTLMTLIVLGFLFGKIDDTNHVFQITQADVPPGDPNDGVACAAGDGESGSDCAGSY